MITARQALCKSAELLQAPRKFLSKLRTFERRAVEILLVDEIAGEVFRNGTAGLEHDDTNKIIELLEDSETLSAKIQARRGRRLERRRDRAGFTKN